LLYDLYSNPVANRNEQRNKYGVPRISPDFTRPASNRRFCVSIEDRILRARLLTQASCKPWFCRQVLNTEVVSYEKGVLENEKYELIAND